ncbi:MAG: cytochrome c3 family protein [Terriglobales bacterium]
MNDEGGNVKTINRVLAVVMGLIVAVSMSSFVFAQKAPKDIIIMPAPQGGVKFLHKAHSTERGAKCETCHHPSKTEKPATAAQQACSDCHAKVAQAPMKTKLQAAFHNPAATAGICIDCHKAENAKGKKAPTKCMECHKKENV